MKLIKYYTIQNPPPLLPEPESKLPDLCRQSDFVSLDTLLERFIASGERFVDYQGAQSLSAEEKEVLFDSVEVDDLDDDIAVQHNYVDEVLSNVSSKQEKKEEKPTQTESAPEQPKADAPKE